MLKRFLSIALLGVLFAAPTVVAMEDADLPVEDVVFGDDDQTDDESLPVEAPSQGGIVAKAGGVVTKAKNLADTVVCFVPNKASQLLQNTNIQRVTGVLGVATIAYVVYDNFIAENSEEDEDRSWA